DTRPVVEVDTIESVLKAQVTAGSGAMSLVPVHMEVLVTGGIHIETDPSRFIGRNGVGIRGSLPAGIVGRRRIMRIIAGCEAGTDAADYAGDRGAPVDGWRGRAGAG